MVTLAEWPVAARMYGLGKQAIGFIRRGAAMAARIATLESRVTELEEKLEKQNPDACPGCGERAMRRTETGHLSQANSARRDLWTCQKCGQAEHRLVKF